LLETHGRRTAEKSGGDNESEQENRIGQEAHVARSRSSPPSSFALTQEELEEFKKAHGAYLQFQTGGLDSRPRGMR